MTPDDVPIVRVEDLEKQRGKQRALDGVSFAIRRGSVFGLIGPNGAGKTTAIKILLGMLRPDAGRAEVFGTAPMDLPAAARQRIGYLGERPTELPNLPVAELLEYQSFFFAQWDWDWCRQLVARMGVVQDREIRSLSEGERRRAELLLALAHRPELLILDDPTLGLDARARRDMLWATLAAARDEGTTVLFTSHVLQDVERIVDDVVILDRGKVRLSGPLDELLGRTKRLVFPDVDGGLAPVAGEVRRSAHGRDVAVISTGFSPALAEQLRRSQPLLRVEPLNLEEIFCAVIADPEPAPAQANAEAGGA